MAATEAVVSSQEIRSTMLVGIGSADRTTSKEIKEALEKGDNTARAAALENMIRLHLNGEPQNHMIMTVIKYITPVEDHLIKKLVLYFWEVVDRTDKDGNLLSVMILICSFLRNDLQQHPNEYVRGLTLRFLCKVKERDLIEPLIGPVLQNLKHSESYVRRNAVLAVHSIYGKFPDLMPDAPEQVEDLIHTERDVSTRRNAFDMLAKYAPERAAHFLSEFRESNDLVESGSVFLLSVVDFCRQAIRLNPYDRARYVPILFTVLQSKNPAVRFQCASTLLSLSSSPTAIREATLTFVDILKTHSDNSVRLIVIDKLDEMRQRYLHVLQNSMMDVLSTLPNSSTAIRQRVITFAVELVTNKNMDAFVQAIKRELGRATGDTSSAASVEYKQVLVRSLSTALTRRPQCGSTILPVLLDNMCDSPAVGTDVMVLVKEVMRSHPELREPTIKKLRALFPIVSSPTVLRALLWVLGAHSETTEELEAAYQMLKTAVEPLPLTAPAAKKNAADGDAAPAMVAVTTVQEDGTYATTYSAAPTAAEDAIEYGGLRYALCTGDYTLAMALATTLAKLVLRLSAAGASSCKEAQSSSIEILSDILRYGTQPEAPFPIPDDAQEHVRVSISMLSNPSASVLVSLAQSDGWRSCPPLEVPLAEESAAAAEREQQNTVSAVDAPIIFTQLTAEGKDAVYEMEAADDDTGASASAALTLGKAGAFLKHLERTVALSGYTDPIYCEASVVVSEYDVAVDWLIANNTAFLMSNLTIELVSLGGMKLCERPQSYSLAPYELLQVRTSLKVSAAEGGVIHGSVLYDAPNGDRNCIVLSDITVDIMNYIRPAPCRQSEFRDKWGAFGWENKIVLSSKGRPASVRDYIRVLARELNMQLLEPFEGAGEDELNAALCDGEDEEEGFEYVSCNLYARTVFCEEALANISMEGSTKGGVQGVICIRSNTQTIAYGIGEKVNAIEKLNRV